VTRGVPGTHDVDFAIETINKLCKNHTTATYLPRFDKANDTAASKSSWPAITGPVDVIILEGWFVGALPQRNEDLVLPVNDFERNCDADAIWRSYSNQALSRKYKDLFSKIDKLIMLRAPNFDAVYRWRCNQEESLRRAQKNSESTKVMTDQEVFRFIQHFERLTVHCLTTVPDRADIVFSLDSTQQIIEQKGSLSLD
jgi:D-glycerate 3-kinase